MGLGVSAANACLQAHLVFINPSFRSNPGLVPACFGGEGLTISNAAKARCEMAPTVPTSPLLFWTASSLSRGVSREPSCPPVLMPKDRLAELFTLQWASPTTMDKQHKQVSVSWSTFLWYKVWPSSWACFISAGPTGSTSVGKASGQLKHTITGQLCLFKPKPGKQNNRDY